jgi:hypothetical protein
MKMMKQTLNAKRSTPNAEFRRDSGFDIECWTLATAEPVQDGGGGLSVGRFLPGLP